MEVDDDRFASRAPGREPRGELRALRFHEHEIAHREFRHIGILKRARVIFLRALFLQPAFADENLRVVSVLPVRRATRR